VITVVATKFRGRTMEGERDTAIGTVRDRPTGPALEIRGVSPAVEQKKSLLASEQRLLQSFIECLGPRNTTGGLDHLRAAEIHDSDGRQGALHDPTWQIETHHPWPDPTDRLE
jgi:hypothetical protein